MDRQQGESDMTQAQAVRKWATAQGYDVGVRGRIAPAIWEAYAGAHSEFQRETPPGSASCKCGRNWTGVRECHCTVCHCHFSTVANFDAHRPHGVCVNPLEARLGGYNLKAKATVWGTIYVTDKEHYKTAELDGLYDDE